MSLQNSSRRNISVFLYWKNRQNETGVQVIPKRVFTFAQTTGFVNAEWLLTYKFIALTAGLVVTDTFTAATGAGSAADSASGSGSSMAAWAWPLAPALAGARVEEEGACSSLARLGARSSLSPSPAWLPCERLLFEFGLDMAWAIEQDPREGMRALSGWHAGVGPAGRPAGKLF